jgi:hypothetical protein
MSDPTIEFFDRVGRTRPNYLPRKFDGTMRFDLRHGERTEHWYLTICDGDVEVSREHSTADSVLRTDKELFDRLVTGHRGVKAALLRGALTVEGDIQLLTVFRDLLPGPPGAHDPGVRARARRLREAADFAEPDRGAGEHPRPGGAVQERREEMT